MRLHSDVKREKLEKEMKKFVGKIIQLPPVKSRVKREERERQVYYWKILEKKERNVLFEVKCEAGTYVRKLISDLGLKIGGAHMAELRRIEASIFTEKDKNFINLYEFEKAVSEFERGNEDKLRKILIPAEIISKILPVMKVKKQARKKLWNGSPLFPEFLKKGEEIKDEKFVAFSDDVFIGVYKKVKEEAILARPEYVFKPN